MDWITAILGTGAAVASGGITGVIGGLIGRVSKHFSEKAEREWEKEKWKYEEKMLRLNMEAKAAETEQELAIVSQSGSWGALADSIKADAEISKVTSPAVNGVRSLFRPFFTTAIWALAGWVFYKLIDGSMVEWMSQSEVSELVHYCVYSVFYVASTAALWWFAERALTPPGQKHR